jgi:hypothetical protein
VSAANSIADALTFLGDALFLIRCAETRLGTKGTQDGMPMQECGYGARGSFDAVERRMWLDRRGKPADQLDLATVNPPSDRTSSRAGAISGPLTVSPKEAIEWECEIDNTSDGVLTFRNEVNTGEMCILSGAAAAVTGDTKPFGCNRN